MLLILKTNDLIRGIEATLGTQNRMTAFWVMSKHCIHSSYNEQKRKRTNWFRKYKISLREKWEIFKVNIYYLYQGIVNYGPYAVIKQMIFAESGTM